MPEMRNAMNENPNGKQNNVPQSTCDTNTGEYSFTI